MSLTALKQGQGMAHSHTRASQTKKLTFCTLWCSNRDEPKDLELLELYRNWNTSH